MINFAKPAGRFQKARFDRFEVIPISHICIHFLQMEVMAAERDRSRTAASKRSFAFIPTKLINELDLARPSPV
jgi:hypothetical protein